MDSDEGLSCDPLALILSFTSHADACVLILAADTKRTGLKGKHSGAFQTQRNGALKEKIFALVPIIPKASRY